MSVFRSIVFSAVVAGGIVGCVATAAQQFSTVPLILKAEVFEQLADGSASTEAAGPGAEHDHGNRAHEEAVWEPRNGFERNAFTAAANVLTAIGFGLLLAGLYALRGEPVTWRAGMFWGLGGFVVFTLAPGLGLPPELPGVPAGTLEWRQAWWLGTALATAAGLGLLFLRRSPWAAFCGLCLLAVPHVLGAPLPDDLHTNVPGMLSRQFVSAVTLTGLLFWTLLGVLTSIAYQYFSDPVRRPQFSS